jgi:hypothetical protein
MAKKERNQGSVVDRARAKRASAGEHERGSELTAALAASHCDS